MNLVNKDITLNITPGSMPPVLHVSEYDTGRNFIVALIDEDGKPYTIQTGADVEIVGTLNNKYGFTVEPNAITDSFITFTLTEQMTAYAGKAWCKIKLIEPGSGARPSIQTCAFILAVDRAGVEADTVIGAPGFEEQINNAVDEWLEDQGISSPTIDLEETANGVEITVEDARGTPQTAVIPAIPSGGTDSQPLTSDGNGGMFWGEARYNDAVRFFLVEILRNCLMSIDQSDLIDTLDAVILGEDDGITKNGDLLTVRFLLHNSSAQLGNSIMIS